MAHFARNAPSKQADGAGRARWLADGPAALVVGAENDFIVDSEGVEETAAFLGTTPLVLPGLPHDIMLDTRWEAAAECVVEWIASLQSGRALM